MEEGRGAMLGASMDGADSRETQPALLECSSEGYLVGIMIVLSPALRPLSSHSERFEVEA